MHKIILKQTPEDFIVEEVIDIPLTTKGNYLIAKIKKTNLNTLDVVNILQNQLKIPRKFISFAGSKDKRAITTQCFSIQGIKEEKLKAINNSNLEFEFLGYSKKPISLGTLNGNKFTITLDFKPQTLNFMPNYFGEQRFSKNNSEIGKAIIKKDFKTACNLIDQPIIKFSLEKQPTDFIGAIKKLDKKLISLYINAYQSFLWNKAVIQYFKQTLKPNEYLTNADLIFPKKIIKTPVIPLISFDTEFKNKKVREIYEKILIDENIQLSDFLIRSFPDQLPITTAREVFIEVKNIKWENNKITFELPKGAYATIFIKELEALN